MATAMVEGLSIAYEIIGPYDGRPWAITPGGRFSKETAGVRELAEALADRGQRVLIWDRPNCGASDVCFDGPSESAMQADVLAALLTQLRMTPAVIAGGSGGSRISLLTVARHRELATGLAMWWISGGVYGLDDAGHPLTAASRCAAAWSGDGGGGRPARVAGEVQATNDANRGRSSWPRTERRSSPRWSGGWPSTAPTTMSSFLVCATLQGRGREARPTRPDIPQRYDRPEPPAGDVGGDRRRAARRQVGGAAVG